MKKYPRLHVEIGGISSNSSRPELWGIAFSRMLRHSAALSGWEIDASK